MVAAFTSISVGLCERRNSRPTGIEAALKILVEAFPEPSQTLWRFLTPGGTRPKLHTDYVDAPRTCRGDAHGYNLASLWSRTTAPNQKHFGCFSYDRSSTQDKSVA